ncbi:hypothetical protein K435DRAFT_855654 [Dendrothele bispora CBS 962.96]|uniref:Sc15 protein n=1 Tax=Dendrothele bispora (strain CBS 962.96) TaxID=1314807 RepID=A0A4V4HGM8_DENBC|nr:hypothetical protein K435DRAFT_855654 [Dendrothele bispora CBS 962.96]
MIFSRVLSLFSFLTFFLTFSLVASNPVTFPQARSDTATIKRQNADVDSVMNTLQGQVGGILPQIDSLVSGGNVTEDSFTPLIIQLTLALNNAANDLANIPPSSLSKRQSKDAIASIIGGIVTDISVTLNGLLVSTAFIPTVGPLFSVLKLVAILLVDVSKLLHALSFGLVLTALGL